MQYAVCCVPVSPLRYEPSHTAEMVSQQLFGECCTVIEIVPNWIRIRCKYDAYEGWCQASHLIDIDEKQFFFQKEKLTAGYLNKIIYNGQKMMVPFGSSVATFLKHTFFWQQNTGNYKGEIYTPSKESINKKNVRRIARTYLNTPYLWGGKSVFGIDCSGFSQAVYKFLNIYLPRDSSEQAKSGTTIDFLQQVNCGDLCFFDNLDGKIVHVGILLNPRKIIHSSGKVRIDDIDEKGIINSDTKERTHSKKMIKRYFDVSH